MQTACLLPGHAWETLVRVAFGVEGNCSSLPLPLPPILNGADWEHIRRGGLEAFISVSAFLVSELPKGK